MVNVNMFTFWYFRFVFLDLDLYARILYYSKQYLPTLGFKR